MILFTYPEMLCLPAVRSHDCSPELFQFVTCVVKIRPFDALAIGKMLEHSSMLSAEVHRRRTVATAHRDRHRHSARTLVPVSTLPAAEVQAQATLQTRLDKGYFSKMVTPECGSSPMSVIPTESPSFPPEFSLDKPTGNAFLIASTIVAALGLALYFASSLLALAASLASSLAESDPERLAAMTLAGFVAQLVDGSLGMGYGMTSSTVLVASGLSPAAASTSVHLAQLGTTALSGLAHYQSGNVDLGVTAHIGAAGMVGAFWGAALLSLLPTKAAKPIASGLLFAVGVYVLARFYRDKSHCARVGRPGRAVLLPLGLVGGFVDATGGGGWGPVATSGLLAGGQLRPSRVIGSVSASEFLVTVAAVAGFCAAPFLEAAVAAAAAAAAGGDVAAEQAAEQAAAEQAHGGSHLGLHLDIVLTLLVGGLLAAPLAPRLVGCLKPRLLGVTVGGFICVTNARGLLALSGASGSRCAAFYAVLTTVWLGAVARVAARDGVRPDPQSA